MNMKLLSVCHFENVDWLNCEDNISIEREQCNTIIPMLVFKLKHTSAQQVYPQPSTSFMPGCRHLPKLPLYLISYIPFTHIFIFTVQQYIIFHKFP